ncbi:MAG: acyl-CoA synthetase FdrA [Oscillospiraceae bacterium]|nr:acyl-CoA synthetase FdrA [Oscillospiraceae bacterium]
MLKTIVNRGSYQDSVVLMLLTNRISTMEGVHKVSIMMATPANKDMFRAAGMDTEEVLEAGANDMVIVADVDTDETMTAIVNEVEQFLKDQTTKAEASDSTTVVKRWNEAIDKMPDANLAIISIPGIYAAAEADRALDEGLNVFMFSDNVTIEDEKKLKQKAHEKGLVVMGPDCGTGIIQGVPLAFTNSVNTGKIGIIGASGTGIQELTTIIDRIGEGVTNAIGTGGRDLSTTVGGITMMDCIEAMEKDDETKVLIVISKPPAKTVRDMISARLSAFKKPVVTVFLGEKPEYHEENFYHAYTLDEAARIAVELLRGQNVSVHKAELPEGDFFKAEEKKTIKAYYSGGTLAGEAAMLIKDALSLRIPPEKAEGFMLNTDGHIVVDLGDDVYTQGKPHPMIDPAKRIECMQDACDDPSTGVILLDIVLGYGSHEDMAGALLPSINALKNKAQSENRKLFFVATVCGTRSDYQNYDSQVKKLMDNGVFVCESNKIAVEAAIKIIGHSFDEPEKEIRPKEKAKYIRNNPSEELMQLITEKPVIINIGLRSFAEVIAEYNCKVLQFDWTPPAQGDLQLIDTLQYLRNYKF